MIKLAPEGYPFIVFFAAVTAAAFYAGGAPIALLPFILTLFMLYFFRDPDRTVPAEEGCYVSPADGRVLQVHTVTENVYLKGAAIEVSIFMSPLDVHVNRAPCNGVVESVVHTPGRFLSAFKPEASSVNENIALLLKGDHGQALVRQVAGAVARRAVCRVKPGDVLKKGERYGIIKFSSRVDIFFPEDTDIRVKPGDRVKAGETTLGCRR
jgi:phosphatidylserine decarboxylase